MIVRPLAAADRAAWQPLWQGYLTFYETQVAPAVTDVTWGRLLDPAVDIHGLAAEVDGAIVGIVHYLFHLNTWATEDRCYLEDLFVDPEARGTGAGRALIEAVYAAADERNADQVYWMTQEFNETARRLYDRVGQVTPFIKYRR